MHVCVKRQGGRDLDATASQVSHHIGSIWGSV